MTIIAAILKHNNLSYAQVSSGYSLQKLTMLDIFFFFLQFKSVPALELERSLVQFPHTISFGSIACSVLRKWLLALLQVDELAQSLELRMFLSLADVDSDDSIDDSSEDHQLDNMIDFSKQNEINNDLNVGLDDFVTVSASFN